MALKPMIILKFILERGEKNEIKIEADDNLTRYYRYGFKRQNTSFIHYKRKYNFKKLIVRVTYKSDLNW